MLDPGLNELPHMARFGRQRLAEFGLAPGLLHINHGSYGAIPHSVIEHQRHVQDQLRANPSGFFRADYPQRVRSAAGRVAGFLGGDPEDWVFVENATAAANAVLSSLTFRAGDEILTTDQVYGAVGKTIRYWCARTGARMVEARIDLPVTGPNEIADEVLGAVTAKTKIAVLDHITSTAGIVFPIQSICAKLRAKGIMTFVDGAHVPGNIDVDVPALGVDFFGCNAHKWLCAPPGAGMFWCRKDQQSGVRPPVISHGHGVGFADAFDWQGTRDPSAWLSVPAAISFHLSEGGEMLRQRNRDLACDAAVVLAEEFGTLIAAPRGMQTSMATVRLPVGAQLGFDDKERLQIELETAENVVVSVSWISGALWLRLSAAIYNDAEDLIEAGRRVRQALEKRYGRA